MIFRPVTWTVLFRYAFSSLADANDARDAEMCIRKHALRRDHEYAYYALRNLRNNLFRSAQLDMWLNNMNMMLPEVA